MRFDEFWTGDEATTATDGGDVPLLPDGRHVGDVKVARFKPVDWKKSPANPEGMCLNICVEVAGHQAVWADVPVQFRGLIEAVCRSARVHPPAKGEDWDEGGLKGQTVSIETVQYINKKGEQRVRIEKWHPSTAPLPKAIAAAPAAEKTTTKAQPIGVEDDIPF